MTASQRAITQTSQRPSSSQASRENAGCARGGPACAATPRRNPQRAGSGGHFWLGRLLIAALLLSAPPLRAADQPPTARRSSLKRLSVACVADPGVADIQANARRHVAAIEREAARKTRVVVFSECSLSSYNPDYIRTLRPEQIDAALATLREACRRLDIYAVVGSPYYEGGKRYNGAFVLGPGGEIVKRFAKVHTVEGSLFEDGNELAIFRIDDVPATLMVCHDERYPELFRIPVLAGAKIGIYISCESKEPLQKQDNYRSQIMARAVENQISVVHCNTGDGGGELGSHGHSRIIDKAGRILAEADSRPDEVIRAEIRPDQSSNDYARAGAATPSLRAFWEEGLRVLREQNPEYFNHTDAGANP